MSTGQWSSRDVHGCRAAVERMCRGAAVVVGALGVLLVVKRLAFGAMMADPSSAWGIYNGVGEFHEMSLGVAMVALACAVGLPARRIAWWVVRPVERGCPACGYEAEPTAEKACPECGWKAVGARE